MKKKNLHLLSAITIGAIIIAATSYCVWKMNKDIDNVNIVELNIKASDWRTYKNEEFGFELQYPKKYENDDNYAIWDTNAKHEKIRYDGESWGINKYQETIISIDAYLQNKKEEIFKDNFYKLTGEKISIGNNITAEKIDYYGLMFVERDGFIYFISTGFPELPKFQFSIPELPDGGVTEFNEYQNILKTLKIN